MIPNQRGDHNHSNKRWTNLMPFFVSLVVIAEIAFLGRLDIVNKSSMVNSWADSFYQFTTLPWSSSFDPPDDSDVIFGSGQTGVLDSEIQSCEEWLEREDYVVYSRDFRNEPIFVSGSNEDFKSCAVGCKFGFNSGKKPDAAIGLGHTNGAPSVLRSMESAQYYAENNIAYARR